jgi:hypothetical protein
VKKLILLMAMAPALALAAPKEVAHGPGAGMGGPDDPAKLERAQKRMRLARVLGLAEALDLDDVGAMKAREILARYDGKCTSLRRQMRDGLRVLHQAAHGDQAAIAQVDATLQRIRETRGQLQTYNAEMFNELTQGLTPDKKARAALFLARFELRAAQMMWRGGPGHGMHGGRQHAAGPGRAGEQDNERHAMASPGAPGGAGNGPDMDDWFSED